MGALQVVVVQCKGHGLKCAGCACCKGVVSDIEGMVALQIVLILDQREQFDRSRQVGSHAVGREQSRDEYVDRLRRKGTDVEVRHLEGMGPLLAFQYVLRAMCCAVLLTRTAIQMTRHRLRGTVLLLKVKHHWPYGPMTSSQPFYSRVHE